MQVLFRDELLDVVDCNGFVDGAPCAGGFATLIADASADCGERIVLFDKFQRFPVLAFFGFSYVALNRDVSGTCNLTRRRTRFVAVDAVVVAVIFVPLVGSPAEIVGEFVLRIFDFALFRAKFLSEFYRAGGAVFHALAARHAFVFSTLATYALLDILGVLKSCDVRRALQILTLQLQIAKILFSPSIFVI